jgi:hypothetical protein
MQLSLNTDDIIKEAADKQFEIEFDSEYNAYMKCKQSLEVNMTEVYAFIWKQCAKSMQNKIKAQTELATKI